MAMVTLEELRIALRQFKNWEIEGFEPPERLVAIELKKGNSEEAQFAPSLAQKTITYEGRDATVVLDFDDKGLLVSLEIV
jgi:hypothetical protein